MIASLRQRHCRIFAALGGLLPLLFVAGIAARKTMPQIEAPLLALPSQTVSFAAIDFEHDDLFPKSQVQVRFWREQGAKRVAIDFIAPKNFLEPDLMVYWSAARPTANDSLPSNSILLGAFAAVPLTLSDEALAKPGFLILFSLANQEIVEVLKLTRFTEATN